jgi:molecular chaperone GrpE
MSDAKNRDDGPNGKTGGTEETPEEVSAEAPQSEPANDAAGEPAGDAPLDAFSDPSRDPADEMEAAIKGDKTYEELLVENSALKDRLLRAMAETENIRRRSAREKQEASKFGISNFARDLVEVADNLKRALASVPAGSEEAENEAVKNLLSGIEMTDKEVHSVFERHGLKVIHPVGEKFDPNFHQAIAEVPSEDQPHGHVVDVVQTGYVIDDRLLRPAMVTVARGMPKNSD